MATFLTNLMQSIFTPGPTQSLIVATNVAFAGLQLVLLLLLILTYSVHFVVLSVLCAGLWWSINWFVAELAEAQKRAEEERGRGVGDDGGDSTDAETVVEGVGKGGSGREVEGLAEVKGRSRRDDAVGGSGKSEISTEDEWEKVSENEKDK